MTPSREASWALTPRSKRNKPPNCKIIGQSRVPRIAKLMALAIKLDEQVRQGVFRDYAEIARLGYVTRARLTQIMNLLNLAPDIQEQLLIHSENITERQVRQVSRQVDWGSQRSLWSEVGIPKSG